MAIAYLMGNKVYTNDRGETWYYADTNQRVSKNDWLTCPACSKRARLNDPDPCLGVLPGVKNACCGHGVYKNAYISFKNGVVIRGHLDIVENLKTGEEIHIPDRDELF